MDDGVAATGASLDAGVFGGAALSLALRAAALCPAAPLTPAVLVITPLLAEPIVLLAFSSTFLQAPMPNMSTVAASTADE
ncbi:hypothetical protein [Paraburkholderia sp. SIMBA_054]|uniref:hypothetical protein n=1 Tax=Paraburkholderia sp. SIMBA_054 TaxID=3085795 RepID=UPI0039791F11